VYGIVVLTTPGGSKCKLICLEDTQRLVQGYYDSVKPFVYVARHPGAASATMTLMRFKIVDTGKSLGQK